MSFKIAFRSLMGDILSSWVSTLAKMVTDWVSSLALQLAKFVAHKIMINVVHKAAGAVQVATDTTIAAQSEALSRASHLREAFMDAKSAAGKAFRSAMHLPFPVNMVVAPVVAAAAFAGVMALSAERGALLPNENAIAFTHPSEMILPKHISQGLQGIIANGAGNPNSGGGVQMHQNNTYHGSPAMTRQQMESFHRASIRKAASMLRNRQAFA